MKRSLGTNTEYTALAYRRALLIECIAHLQSFTAMAGVEPTSSVISEEVLMSERVVPEEEILSLVSELEKEKVEIRLEMDGFDFVKREKNVKAKSVKAGTTSKAGRRATSRTQAGKANPRGG